MIQLKLLVFLFGLKPKGAAPRNKKSTVKTFPINECELLVDRISRRAQFHFFPSWRGCTPRVLKRLMRECRYANVSLLDMRFYRLNYLIFNFLLPFSDDVLLQTGEPKPTLAAFE